VVVLVVAVGNKCFYSTCCSGGGGGVGVGEVASFSTAIEL